VERSLSLFLGYGLDRQQTPILLKVNQSAEKSLASNAWLQFWGNFSNRTVEASQIICGL
jgi:hypothetical protein